ncbi:MAG: four helix bundle protein [Bacteroidales bacterium]|nr:four helix bundle protein [Bacteroidales bacterium]
MRNFRTYKIWNDAVELCTEIYKISHTFPASETYALANQMQRASVSIASNIAEGCSRKSEVEFAHFLEMAIGSAFEVETQLLIAKQLMYIDEQTYQMQETVLNELEKNINRLITKLRANS